MKLHLPNRLRKVLLTCVALAATAGSTSYGAYYGIEKEGNFFADAFEFSFTYQTTTTDTILASYRGDCSVNDHSWCKFLLLSDGSLKLVRTNNDGNALTTIGTIRDGSLFTASGSAYALEAGKTYTVKYLGGANGSAAADLYLDGAKVASFTGGSFNMNGSADPLPLDINSTYTAMVTGASWNVTTGETADLSATVEGNWTLTDGTMFSSSMNGNGTTVAGLDLEFGDAANLVKKLNVGNTLNLKADTISFKDSYTLNGTGAGSINARTSISIAEGKTLTLTGTGKLATASLSGTVNIAKDASWAVSTVNVNAISTVTGEGNLVVDSGKEILGYNGSTKFTGKLIIKTGGEVRLGVDGDIAGNGTVDLTSLTGGIELAGGTLSTRFLSGEIGNISVTADSVFNPIDIKDPGTNQLSVGTIDLTANLTVKTGWKANIDVDGITGTGNLTFTNTSEDGQGRDLFINSVNGFTGKLIVDNSKADNGVDNNKNPGRLHVTIGKEETLSASQLAVNTVYGSITLDGAGTFNVAADGSIAKGTWKTQRTEGEQTIVEEHTGEKGSFADTWTGTAVLKGVALADTDLNTYGNAGSTVELVNSTGTLKAGDINTKVQFGSAALALKTTGTNANQTFTFTKAVSGNGNFCIESSVPTDGTEDNKYKADTYKFTGDTSAWNGKLIAGNNTHTNVEFDGTTAINNEIDATNGATMNASIVNNSGVTVSKQVNQNPWSATNSTGTINLTVSNKTAESTGSVTFADVVNVSTTTLGDKVSAVFNSASTLGTLTLNAGASVTGTGPLNISNLVMSDGSSIAADKAITLGGMLSIDGVVTLDGSLLDGLSSLTASDTLTLFTGVSTLALNGTEYSTVTRNLLGEEDLATYFTGVESGQFYLGYDANGTVYAGKVVPEPTTATLSLLALAGLAARRRRK